MNFPVQVIVISLKTSPRRAHIQKYLNNLNIPFEFFDGILGRQDLNNPNPFSPLLSNGIVGCTRSHLGVYQKIIDLKIPYALVLEDDILIHDLDLLISQISWLVSLYPKLQWEFIRLYQHRKNIPLTTLISNPPFSLDIQHKRGFSTAAFLVSQKGAEQCLANLPKNIYEPIDRYLDNIHRSKIKLLISDAHLISINFSFNTETQGNHSIKKSAPWKKFKDSLGMRWATWKMIRHYRKILKK